jgi:hypothetical protein
MMTMKITNADVIKTGEQELIDAITADLDWGIIEEIFRKEHKLGIEEEIEYKKGDIVAYNNQIAYRLEFEVKVNLAVLLNREGEYISISISGDEDETEDAPSERSVDVEDENEDNAMDTSSETIQKNDTSSDDNLDPELQNDDKEKGEDAFKEALDELDSMDAEEDEALSQEDRSDDETADKISQLASRVGKLMKKEKKG